MDCSRSSDSASGQINLRCLASSCTSSTRFQEDVADLDGLPALGRVHPLKESIKERVVREDAVLRLFPARLAHDVLNKSGPSRPVLCWRKPRVVRDIRVAVKAPEYARPSIFTVF